MILYDTSVIIDIFRNSIEPYKELLLNKKSYICGVIISELIAGSKSPKQEKNILKSVNDFNLIDMEFSDWIDIGKNNSILRKKGITVPFQDIVISTLAMNNNLKVITLDHHYKIIADIIEMDLIEL